MKFYITNLDFESIIKKIIDSINFKKRIVINYLNFYTVVSSYRNIKLYKSLTDADVVHQDGIGITFSRNNFINRFNFTDYGFEYLKLCELKKWSIFIFGGTHENITLAVDKIQLRYPHLNIKGYSSGYNYNNEDIIKKINSLQPNILLVGLGLGKQEIWINENKQRLNCNVIHAVGDLINLYAEKKNRGVPVFRKIGLEWLVRLVYNPRRYFKRYVLGIPVYIYYLLVKKFTIELRK